MIFFHRIVDKLTSSSPLLLVILPEPSLFLRNLHLSQAPSDEPFKSSSVMTIPARGCGEGEVGHSDEAGREPVPYGREQDRTDDQAKLPTFRV